MEEELECEENEDILFAEAKEFLRIVQPKTSIPRGQVSTSAESQSKDAKRKTVQFGVHKIKKSKTLKSDNIALTSLQRKKLERVRTPVTSFRKPQTQNGLSEIEKEESVRKMLEYIRRMPHQEIYIPTQAVHEEASFISETSKEVHGKEFRYLTSEQELRTWKLLRSSPKNCNVFIGNLSYRVDETLLLAAFQPFVVEKQQNHLKVRIVTDPRSGASKGYGFIQFPYRRAAELALICMQGFEIYGREIQLGWGQEVATNVSQPGKDTIESVKKVGLVISDSFCGSLASHRLRKRREKTRWDVEPCAKGSREGLPSTKMKEAIGNDGVVNSLVSIFSNVRSAHELKLSQENCDLPVTKIQSGVSSSTEFDATENEVNNELIGGETTAKGGKMKKLNKELTTVSGGLVEKDASLVSHFLTLEQEANVVERKANSDKPIEWLTRAQRAKMIEAVCRSLRKKGVKDHLGVFGVHFEVDNSRLFVIFSKTLGEEELKCEFKKYGEVNIKINRDTCGVSKGSAIVQYATSALAETALKQLHGKTSSDGRSIRGSFDATGET